MSEPTRDASTTREVRLGRPPIHFAHAADGSIVVDSPQPLGAYPDTLTDRLLHWAATTPDHTLFAQREGDGWRRVSYRDALDAACRIGQALLDRGLGPDRPVMILSGNDIEHALLGLACLHVGIPYAPISVAYSTVATDFARLRGIAAILRPGLVFASEGALFGRAIATVLPGVEAVLTRGDPGSSLAGHTAFASLLATAVTPAVAAAAAAVGPDTVAKILFTSGSTGTPKGVINTQRMLCSNQRMILESFAFMEAMPPVILDWLPWNHTFGGNHNVGLVLYNGGTLYIDDGAPTPSGIARTVRNLREVAPTVYFNVPKGYEELVAHLRADAALRAHFFSRLELMFYAGAGLAQHVWDELNDLAAATTGQRVVMLTGLGSTETAPFALVCRPDVTGSGIVGLPVPGVVLKLVRDGDKLEARIRGPNVTPGYWRDPAQTAGAFDDQGFYCLGDALAFVDAAAPDKGFRFDGRLSEDFKLATGTWVRVGALRMRMVAALAPYARDVVVAGHDADFIGILVVPDPPACNGLAGAALLAALRPLLHAAARAATGSSNRVLRAALLEGPLSLDAGEITDKGSINQRAVLRLRSALVDALYADPAPASIIEAAMEIA